MTAVRDTLHAGKVEDRVLLHVLELNVSAHLEEEDRHIRLPAHKTGHMTAYHRSHDSLSQVT